MFLQRLVLLSYSITVLEPAELIHLYPAIQTTIFTICRDLKMKAKKLLCHFS